MERPGKTATFPLTMASRGKGGEYMTNLDKFIEVMNTTFNAKFKPENMELKCCPCGTLKKPKYACSHFKCEKCEAWWHKEYEEPKKGA